MPLRTGMKQKKKDYCLLNSHQHLKEKDALSKEARTTNRKKGICLKSIQFKPLLSAIDYVQGPLSRMKRKVGI